MIKIDTLKKLKNSKFYKKASNPKSQKKIYKEFSKKISKTSINFRELIENAKLLYEMLFNKDYKITFESKMIIIAALLYFISPIDFIPDFIPVVGLLDDGVVIGIAINHLKTEIHKYKTSRINI